MWLHVIQAIYRTLLYTLIQWNVLKRGPDDSKYNTCEYEYEYIHYELKAKLDLLKVAILLLDWEPC